MYDKWQKSTDALLMSIYYNMKVGKYVFINGSGKDQLEISNTDDVLIAQYVPYYILRRIERIWEEEWYVGTQSALCE
jgi:hypothetical protein